MIKSMPRLLPIFSGASNSTSTKPTLLAGSAGQGGESEDMILWRIGEMTLQGGQYPADQYVMRGVRDEVDSRIVSCRAAGWRTLRKGWRVSGEEQKVESERRGGDHLRCVDAVFGRVGCGRGELANAADAHTHAGGGGGESDRHDGRLRAAAPR